MWLLYLNTNKSSRAWPAPGDSEFWSGALKLNNRDWSNSTMRLCFQWPRKCRGESTGSINNNTRSECGALIVIQTRHPARRAASEKMWTRRKERGAASVVGVLYLHVGRDLLCVHRRTSFQVQDQSRRRLFLPAYMTLWLIVRRSSHGLQYIVIPGAADTETTHKARGNCQRQYNGCLFGCMAWERRRITRFCALIILNMIKLYFDRLREKQKVTCYILTGVEAKNELLERNRKHPHTEGERWIITQEEENHDSIKFFGWET